MAMVTYISCSRMRMRSMACEGSERLIEVSMSKSNEFLGFLS